MPLRNYHVLKGQPTALALDDDSSPHIEIRLSAAGQDHRIAVNVRSQQSPHDLLYRKQDPFAHPLRAQLVELADGLTDLRGDRPELALDYVRGDFVERGAMEVAPFQRVGPQNDLRDFIEPAIEAGIGDPNFRVYAFGEAWGPEPDNPDKYFGFLPGRGIHDIHMNQGSTGRFANSNGPNQDGALVLHDGTADHWTAIYLAFQSQRWTTDAHGHPTDPEVTPGRPPLEPTASSVLIVAALVNASGPEEGQESVTLLNRGDADLELAGWELRDKVGRSLGLAGTLAAGETHRIVIPAAPGAPRLGNQGGKILLAEPGGSVAHAIEYAKSQVSRDGWTSVF